VRSPLAGLIIAVPKIGRRAFGCLRERSAY
jgi:hypothetical protein